MGAKGELSPGGCARSFLLHPLRPDFPLGGRGGALGRDGGGAADALDEGRRVSCGEPRLRQAVICRPSQPPLVPLVSAGEAVEREDDRAAVGAKGGCLLVRRAEGAVREGDILELHRREATVGVEGMPQGAVVREFLPVTEDPRQVASGRVLDDPVDGPSVAGEDDARDKAADGYGPVDVDGPLGVPASRSAGVVIGGLRPPLVLDGEKLGTVVRGDRVRAARRREPDEVGALGGLDDHVSRTLEQDVVGVPSLEKIEVQDRPALPSEGAGEANGPVGFA